MPENKKLPQEVIDHWPEVFKHVDIDVVPLEYLQTILVTFEDGKIWEIDTQKNSQNIDLEAAIESLFDEYEDVIQSVDFRLDTARVKRDIKKRTAQFLKKRR